MSEFCSFTRAHILYSVMQPRPKAGFLIGCPIKYVDTIRRRRYLARMSRRTKNLSRKKKNLIRRAVLEYRVAD